MLRIGVLALVIVCWVCLAGSVGCAGGGVSPASLAERHGLEWTPLSLVEGDVAWPAPLDGGPLAPTRQLAVASLEPSSGFEIGGQWLATADGAFEADLPLRGGPVEITLVLKGIAETGDWPSVRVLLDGREIGSARLDGNASDREVTERFTSPRYRWLRVPFRAEFSPGIARLRVEYDCSAFDPVERIGMRGVLFDRIEIRERPRPGDVCAPGVPGASPRKVLMLGIDGASWGLILPMVNEGGLPNLAALLKEGSYGPLESEPMTYSPAVWNTIYTGRGRSTHGIDQMSAKSTTFYSGTSHSTASLRSATLWQMLSAAGKSVVAVGMHTTWPAQPVRGVLVSDRAIDGPVEGGVWPLDQDSAVTRAVEELNANPEQLPEVIPSGLRKVALHDARVVALARAYLSEGQPDLAAVYLAMPDHAGHMLWESHAPFGLDHRFDVGSNQPRGGSLRAAYELVDDFVGQILDSVDRESTAVVVVSDHSTDLADPVTRTRFRMGPLVRAVAGERAYVPFEESWIFSHIYLNVRGREPNGAVEPSRYAAEAASIRDALVSLETNAGRPVFESVKVLPASAATGVAPGAYQAADIVGIVNARIAGDELIQLPSGESIPMDRIVHFLENRTGTHDRYGVLMVAGSGARQGGLVRSATIRDVVPTVLSLLGLPLGADLPGRPVAEALEGRDAPSCFIASWDPIALRNEPTPSSGMALTEEERERLKALGYVQ